MDKPPLPERPLLKRHLLAATIEPADVLLLSEDRAWLWQHRGLRRLVPLLDGARTTPDLFGELWATVSPPEIVYLLAQLHDQGLLAEGTAPEEAAPDGALALWHALGVDGHAAAGVRRATGTAPSRCGMRWGSMATRPPACAEPRSG
jgi:hypothetical protein